MRKKANLESVAKIICWKNQNILNMMIMEKPSLLSSSLQFIVKGKKSVITFVNKRQHFYNTLKG